MLGNGIYESIYSAKAIVNELNINKQNPGFLCRRIATQEGIQIS